MDTEEEAEEVNKGSPFEAFASLSCSGQALDCAWLRHRFAHDDNLGRKGER
jgi:hypothetical protein